MLYSLQMSLHEEKYCPRCLKVFECKPGNITQCQCYDIQMTTEQNAYIEDRYNNCLCRNCLSQLQNETRLFKEKIIYR
ncbi:MAG: cysteine-rich CWC family protein [Bacteroidota bacterium]